MCPAAQRIIKSDCREMQAHTVLLLLMLSVVIVAAHAPFNSYTCLTTQCALNRTFTADYRQLAPHFNMLAQELLQDVRTLHMLATGPMCSLACSIIKCHQPLIFSHIYDPFAAKYAHVCVRMHQPDFWSLIHAHGCHSMSVLCCPNFSTPPPKSTVHTAASAWSCGVAANDAKRHRQQLFPSCWQ